MSDKVAACCTRLVYAVSSASDGFAVFLWYIAGLLGAAAQGVDYLQLTQRRQEGLPLGLWSLVAIDMLVNHVFLVSTIVVFSL